MQVKAENLEQTKDPSHRLKTDSVNEVKQQLHTFFKQNDTKGMHAKRASSLVSSGCASSATANKHVYETLEVITEDNITRITLNRPDKKNAISTKMYNEIIQALKQAGEDDSVITVLTGKGDYYCSGNDLNNATQEAMDGTVKGSRNSTALFKTFAKSFIDFPKPLIAVVNGPAVGAAVTVLGLCDIVYATERATFHTPFTQLGLSPEGCASYTFPIIMGYAKANEMLLFSKKLTAKEACDRGLVTEVFPDSTFQKQVWARVHAYAQLPRQSLTFSKQLVRGLEKEKLHAVNSQECERLIERTASDECRNAILSFFQKKSKL